VPVVDRDGARLHYREHGAGAPVLMVMGTGSPGRVWDLHQVPALVAAGHRVITYDSRGIPPSSECAGGMTIEDLVGDAAAIIEHVGAGPAAVVGTSLGSRVAQELALARPDLVTRAVCMAAHGRVDPLMRAQSAGEKALHDAGIVLPPQHHAAVSAVQNLSPRTLADPDRVRDWLDVLAFSGSAIGPGVRAQLDLDGFADRLGAYARIAVPVLAIGFADDRVVLPGLAREVAAAVPGARYVEVEGCGHFGYLERPQAVNELVLAFLAEREPVGATATAEQR
jgi:pimeloyl-ACP methyl ester carboxylesterase